MNSARKILFVSTIHPESAASAAGVRTVGLIDSLRAHRWHVDFFTHARPRQHADHLNAELYHCGTNSNEFFAILGRSNPSIVIYDRFLAEEQFSWRVRKFDPEILQVVDTQDLHFLRLGREQLVAQRGENVSISEVKDIKIPVTDELLLRELTSLKRSDLVFVCSSYERNLLIREFNMPENKVCELTTELVLTFKNFLMLGGFRHRPNRDSVLWMQRMWPRIRNKLPDAELHVFGSYPSREDMSLTDKKTGFIVKGEIKPDDLYRKISKNRVLLAPLRFGAGIKGKILDAWSVGTPVVTTSIGSEGLSDDLVFLQNLMDWGGRVADTEEAFVDAAISLYSDASQWLECASTGHQLFKENFDFIANSQTLHEDLCEALERKRNASASNNREVTLDEQLFLYHSWKHHEVFSRIVQLKDEHKKE